MTFTEVTRKDVGQLGCDIANPGSGPTIEPKCSIPEVGRPIYGSMKSLNLL